MRQTDKYLPKESDTWQWKRASTDNDITDIVVMAKGFYESEVDSVFKTDPVIMRRNVDLAVTEQKYVLNKQQIIVARNKQTQKLMAWAWLKRGHYTTFAPEEMADAMFIHVDLGLTDRNRITLCAQALQQWILWCSVHGIPVLVSTSIRAEQTAFLRLHEKFGFKRNGSVCYFKVSDYFKE